MPQPNNQIVCSVCTESGSKLLSNIPKQLKVTNTNSLKVPAQG
jgi:hypothetical protein